MIPLTLLPGGYTSTYEQDVGPHVSAAMDKIMKKEMAARPALEEAARRIDSSLAE